MSSDGGCENLGVNVLTRVKRRIYKSSEVMRGGDAALHLFYARFEYEAQADIMAGLPDAVLLNINHPSLQYLVALLRYGERSSLVRFGSGY